MLKLSEPSSDLLSFSSKGPIEVLASGVLFNQRFIAQDLSIGFDSKLAELVLESYLKNGHSFVEDFNGEFAFLIYDRSCEKLIAVRDALGNHPLCYLISETGDPQFFFDMSEAVLADVHEKIDYSTLGEYLLGDCFSWERTLFRNIKRVIPGTVMCWQNGRQKETFNFWSVPGEVEGLSYSDSKKLLVDSFRSAIEKRLPSQEDFALSLSGGLDSGIVFSSLLSEYRDQSKRLIPLTSTFQGYDCDESGGVEKLLDVFGIRSKAKFLSASLEGSSFISEECCVFRDLPSFANGVFTDQVRREVAGLGCKYLFTGYGADELFSFSNHIDRRLARPSQFLLGLASRVCPSQFKEFLRARGILKAWIPPWFTKKFREDTGIEELLSAQFQYPSCITANRRPSFKALFDPWAVRLREFEARSARRYRIQLLSPFQDIELIKSCYQIPAKHFLNTSKIDSFQKSFQLSTLGTFIPVGCRSSRVKVDFSSVVKKVLINAEQKKFSGDNPLYDLGWVDREELLKNYEGFIANKKPRSMHSDSWNFWALLGVGEVLSQSNSG